MNAARRTLALFLCLLVTTACGAPRAQRVCGIVDGGPFFQGEMTYLRLIEPDSGAQHTLVRTEEALFNGGLSPDGTKLLYTWRDTTRWGNAWIMPLDGSEPRPLLRGGAPTYVRGATWSYDGSKAVFSAYADDETYPCIDEYYVVDVASGRATRLPVRGCAAAWSPRDPRIAILCSYGEDSGLWLIDTDTGEAERLLQEMEMWEAELAWSPDAREIAVVAGIDLEHVYVVDVESGTGWALTRTDVYDHRLLRLLRWSPAGDKIAFLEIADLIGMLDYGTGPVFVVDVKTGEETRLVEVEGVMWGPLVWSPDGRQIAFDGPSGDRSYGCISTVDVATGQVTQLADEPEPHEILAWGWVTYAQGRGR